MRYKRGRWVRHIDFEDKRGKVVADFNKTLVLVEWSFGGYVIEPKRKVEEITWSRT